MRYPTPKASSSSVKVFWLDRKETIQRLQAAVKALQAQNPEFERAVLFGSLQRGDAVPVDLFVYTRAELDGMLAAGNRFVSRALAEGDDLL